MNSRSRVLAVLVAVVAIGAAVAVGYRYEVQHSPKPPLVGVVHETEIRIAPEISGRLKSLAVDVGAGRCARARRWPNCRVPRSPLRSRRRKRTRSPRAPISPMSRPACVRKRSTRRRSARRSRPPISSLAKAQFARVSTLAAKNFASRQQYDEDAAALAEADAHLNLAQAALAESKAGPTREQLAIAGSEVRLALATIDDVAAQLAKTTLTAPADGVARLLVAEPGEAIVPGQPVLTLGLANDRWFSFTIREDRLGGADDRLDADAPDRGRRPRRSQGHRTPAARGIRGLARGARRRRSRPQQLPAARRPDRSDAQAGTWHDRLDRRGDEGVGCRSRLMLVCTNIGHERTDAPSAELGPPGCPSRLRGRFRFSASRPPRRALFFVPAKGSPLDI